MRRLFTLFVAAILGMAVNAQDIETYTALKVAGDNVPVIDGTIDAIWKDVEMVPLAKVPEHSNITVPDPDPTDFYAEYGMLWNADGIFVVMKIVDDVVVIFDDYYADNGVDADMWWTDDHQNLLFSKDLSDGTAGFTQWEFAYQFNVDQEEKLSSDLWANAALISGDLVQTAWDKSLNDENTYLLETFIEWGAFADGAYTPADDAVIYMEARARDDDDGDGVAGDTWESMFQWSTTNYGVESNGEGMGAITLSGTEVEPSAVAELAVARKLEVFPNPAGQSTKLLISLDSQSDVSVSMFDMSGKLVQKDVFTGNAAGENYINLNVSDVPQGIYFLNVESDSNSGVVKFVKR